MSLVRWKNRKLGVVLMSRRLWLIFIHPVARANACVCATRHAPQTLCRVKWRAPLCARRTRDTLPTLSVSPVLFPLAPHLIASFCRLSRRRRHPNRFSLPHCVTIRGTELISTLPVVPPKRPHDSHLQYYSFTTPSRKEIKLGIFFTSYSFLPVGDTK